MIIQFPSTGGSPEIPREPQKASLPAYIERIAQFLRLSISPKNPLKSTKPWKSRSSKSKASLSHKIEDIAKFLRRQKNP